jgi:PhoH-like ATPase
MKEYKLISQDLKTSGILPRNTEQQFALDLLNDSNLNLITLGGSAGTGKTLLALSAGIKGVLDLQQYTKIVLLKPIVPMDNGHELGFLPGSMEEKLSPWMQSYSDNIEVIMAEYFKEDEPKKKTKKQVENEKSAGKINPVQELMALGLLEFGSLEHIRGRSLPQLFVIIDECQNLSTNSIRTIITRIGEGSKIILMGDTSQIDNPYLDSRSNGLTVTVEAFKGQQIAGHITLKKSERSKLAEIAANIL